MFYFEGSICSGCGAELKETDDIVACPVCGSPHHRECYQQNGGCANEALHGEDFEWKRVGSSSKNESESGQTSGKVFCGVCGAENSSGRLYCFNCGRPLFSDEAGTRAAEDSGDAQFGGEKIDGVPLKDISRYAGNAGMMYAPLFLHMHRNNKKVSFNFFALLFPTFWYLSRKMYLHGILIMLFNIASYFYNFLFYDVISQIYNASMSFDQVAMEKIIIENPLVSGGFLLFGLGSYAIAILSALFSNRLYMNKSLRHIKRLRRKNTDDKAYEAALDAHGRSNFGIVIILMMLYFIAILGVERLLPMV